jgi:hypothetical protein
MENNNLLNVSLLVSSCDLYSDLWLPHSRFLELNWEHLNIRTILLTDKETQFKIKNMEIISISSNNYSKRLIECLKYINTKYVLFSLDDYFLINKVNEKDLSEFLNFMSLNNVKYLRLFKIPNSNKIYSKNNNTFIIDLKNDYDINFYPAIWEKEYLISLIDNFENIWDLESSLTQKARKLNEINLM